VYNNSGEIALYEEYMKNVISWVFTGVFIVALLFVPALSVAKTYSYKDDNGVVHITNRKEDIPDKYQGSTVETVEKKRPLIPSIIAKAKGLINILIDFLNTLTSNVYGLLIIIGAAIIISFVLAYTFIERTLARYVVIIFSLALISLILMFFFLRTATKDNSDIRDSFNKTKSHTAVHKEFYWNLMSQ
jgi:hypothetical protein